MKPTAILLLHCPDQQGIITEITKFITDNQGNIVYLDQYVDRQDGMFFMRLEWELENFLIPRDKILEYFDTLYARRYNMECNLYFSDQRPRMAIFVSKMSHCLYDLLARWKAGEYEVDIPCIVSNHEDLRYVADQFGIPYHVWSIKKDHSNKAEAEQAEMELLKKEKVTFIVLAVCRCQRFHRHFLSQGKATLYGAGDGTGQGKDCQGKEERASQEGGREGEDIRDIL